jgi:type I restriction enzyme, S subunit
MQLSIVNLSQLNPEGRLDAEYYRPSHLAAEALVRSKEHDLLGKLCRLVAGPFGSTVTANKYVAEPTYRYIRGQDVTGFFLRGDDPVYIGEQLFNDLSQFHVRPNDILITVVGMNFGKAAVLCDSDVPAIFSCKSSLLRETTINSFYLAAYFASKTGFQLVRRGRRGAAQPGINLFDLRHIPVPKADDVFQNRIGVLCRSASTLLTQADTQYQRAECLLLENVGLAGWEPTHALTFVRSFSEMMMASRLDAEHFQPKFSQMFHRLPASVILDPLRKLVTMMKGVEVGGRAYVPVGVPFVRVSNISKLGLVPDGTFISSELFEKLRPEYRPTAGVMLLTKDATPGVAYYLDAGVEGIVSSGVLRLRFIADIPPRYLELALNSIFVQLQIEQDAGGSVIRHWKPSQVAQTKIPRLGPEKELAIDALVAESHNARRRAAEILQAVAEAVELSIRGNETEGLVFLSNSFETQITQDSG